MVIDTTTDSPKKVILLAVLVLLVLGLVFVIYQKIVSSRYTPSVDFSKSQAADYGYGYGLPRGKLSYSVQGWDPSLQKWKVQVNYVLHNVQNGSLVKGRNEVVANNLSGSGIILQQLDPRSVTKYALYSLPNGGGRLLDKLTIILPPAPGYGY